ncbi:bifunctional phosphoribosylaminoimidazolecarboxamide formyltransferase/IMP cyclohydrolase [Clavibacter tessellarius]|uniref:bifunctional phosphoribosylaminoimidazolecarboxamide formyltransferase/IMP cyclohydrolase n=1 Tax=Clavibacter tessellarius TaxID=31965 RepID=UPI0039BFA4AD
MSGPRHDPSLFRDRDGIAVTRALVSVSDKTGLLELASALAEAGVEIVSTGSTASTIADAGFPVTPVQDVTGFPEVLDGRVKTLHPSVHAGLLADLRLESHEAQLAEPRHLAVRAGGREPVPVRGDGGVGRSRVGCHRADRHRRPGDGEGVRQEPRERRHRRLAPQLRRGDRGRPGGGTTLAQRRRLASAAFAHTADYDRAVADYFRESVVGSDDAAPTWPASFGVAGDLAQVLRYGENSHQDAALYRSADGAGIAQATQLHGKEMSYNNFVDADAAVRAAYDFVEPAVAIIKHANPCGIAVAPPRAVDAIAAAHRSAHDCDPVSAFGGVIAANRTITLGMAETVKEIFTEVLVAPGFDDDALTLLKSKKNLRLLTLPEGYHRERLEARQISGGYLVQSSDAFPTDGRRLSEGWTLATGEPVDDQTLADLEFAWKACRAVKSNAILLAQHGASVGVGMGQVNRVDSCHLAVQRAGDRAAGSVAASDAFFPFADGLQVLLDAGVRAVVQPGGSVRDEEVVEAARAAGVAMYFTGERHFFH